MYRMLSVSLLLCLLLVSCSEDNPAGADTPLPAIYGRVVDSAGKPVANMEVGLIFSIRPAEEDTTVVSNGTILAPNPASTMTEYQMNLPSAREVVVRIARWSTREIINTLIEGTLAAGLHSLSIDLSDLPNQAYILRNESVTDTIDTIFLVNDTEHPGAVARTDTAGRFVIQYASLPVGLRFQHTFENGASAGWMAVADSLQIVLRSSTGSSRIWGLRVDTTAVVDSTLQVN